jgi:hypothetical protein
MADPCENSNENPGSISGKQNLQNLSEYQFLTEKSYPWTKLDLRN